jgi:chromosome segregation protein
MISTVDSALGDLQIKKAQIDQTLHHMRQDLTASHFSDFAEVQASYEKENMETSAAQEELARHQDRCRKLEPVNMAALADYEALSKRFQFLNSQADDLRNSVSSLRQAISEINKTTQKLFGEAFCSIDQYFGEYCVRLFGGGSAQIRLQGSKEAGEEEAGVELLVSPPGKHLGHLDLLSGGEKALTGLAFLMALFRYRPAPFCFLDEVDAPLDDANVDRYLSLLKEFSPHHQFIVITHNKKTMEAADGLYGVTMEQPGISKVVSVKLDGDKPPKSRRDSQGSSIGEKHGD